MFDPPSVFGKDEESLLVYGLGTTHGVAVEVHLILVSQRVQVYPQVLPFTLAPVWETENQQQSLCKVTLLHSSYFNNTLTICHTRSQMNA